MKIECTCANCGKTFERDEAQVMRAIQRTGGGELFCSKRCFGAKMGRQHGFAAHPENKQPRPAQSMLYCRNGHPLFGPESEAGLQRREGSQPARYCKACNRDRVKKRNQTKSLAGR